MSANAKTKTKLKNQGTGEEDFREFHIAISIEWDGLHSRTQFYVWLHDELGIWVRGGNRDEYPSPMARRQSLDRSSKRNGVVHTEGLYFVRSEDVAKQIADKAKRYGAKSILIFKMFLSEMTMSEEDIAVLEALHKKQSQRGRKSKENAGTYTVTCLRELASFEEHFDAVPLTCPSCNGFHFSVHPGKQKKYQLPKSWNGIDLWDYWQRTRFSVSAEGTVLFEIPKLVQGSKKDMALLPPELSVVSMAEPNIEYPKSLKPDPQLQLKIWDAAYSISKMKKARSRDEYDERLNGRLSIIASMGNVIDEDDEDAPFYSMAYRDDVIDIVDLCILMRKELSEYL